MLPDDFFYLWAFPTLLCVGIAGLLFFIVRSDGILPSLLATPPMAYIGRISYSVYLFHILVELPIFRLFPLKEISSYVLRTFCWGAIALGPTLLVATVSYYLVEAPCMRIADRFRSR